MNKLLIFIGENEYFDVDSTIKAIAAIPGVSDGHPSTNIGAQFEWTYTYEGESVDVELDTQAENIVVVGTGDDALAFALELQRALPVDLRMIDMNYDFDLMLRDFHSIAELSQEIDDQSDS